MHARTPNAALDDLVDALTARNITAAATTDAAGDDQLVEVRTADRHVILAVLGASAPTAATVRDKVGRSGVYRSRGQVPVLVADRISKTSREVLAEHGWGWLDRRGHLRIVAPEMPFIVDADVPKLSQPPRRTGDTLATTVGRDVAVELLLDPGARWGVRELAKQLGRSASAVSIALRDLKDASLINANGAPRHESLFDELVSHWSPRVAHLAVRPTPDLVVGSPRLRGELADLTQEGWALSGSLAAACWGASVALSTDYPPDLYVPDATVLVRAIERFGTADTRSTAAARLLVAPVRRAVVPRFGVQLTMFADSGWPLAHPLFVALDLAGDPGRGREILDAWTPTQGFHRVW